MTDTAALILGCPCFALVAWLIVDRLTARHHVEQEKAMAQRLAHAREAEATRAYIRARLTRD